jgi:Ca2+-binding RTX toxin-like protein
MRRTLVLLATMTLVVVASGSLAVAASSLNNGNFESGDLTSWSVDTTASGGDASASAYGVWFCSWAECWYPLFYGAQEGSYFAQLTPGETSEDTVISQPFEASNGDRISGWAFMHSDDGNKIGYCDSTGKVVIKNESGETVATPFSQCAYGPYIVFQGGVPSGWQNWHYDFTGLSGTGKFTIEARVRNLVDNPAPSTMGLDDVKISTASVELSPPKITSPQNDTYDTDGSFSVSGTAGAGSTVELFEGTTSKGTTKADSSSGAWSIDLSGVSDGTHTYTAKAKDAEGNTSSASNSVTVRVDKTAPTVSDVYPVSGATGAVRNTDFAASFSEPMDPATFTTSTVTLVKEGTTTPISARVGYYESNGYYKVWLSPPYEQGFYLDANTKYTVKIKGGTNGVKDLAGHQLSGGNQASGDYWWTFTTGTQPAPSCTKTGTANAETISGTSGADVICAGGGNDTVKGLGGNDTLLGEGGADTLLGGVGDDTLDGGSGTDTASYSASLTAVTASLATNFSTGEGSDTFLGVENLLGSSIADSLTGSAANNKLTGGGGPDTLKGEDGDDAVDSKDGVKGNDSLDGGGGTDTKVTDATEKSIVNFP